MPDTLVRYGFECELAGGGRETVSLLADRGLIPENRVHSYHCSCSTCNYMTCSYPFRAQADCTADVEIISSPLVYGTPESDSAIQGLADCLAEARATVNSRVGCHVHVTKPSDTATQSLFIANYRHLQTDLAGIAGAAGKTVRSNGCTNGPLPANRSPQRPYWLADGGPTYEFRLWNATVTEWRLHLATAVSTALMEAAHLGRRVRPDDTLDTFLKGLIGLDIMALILRQRRYVATA